MTICKTRTGSRGNLILSLNEANETIKTYPVPAVGYIVYPGFIGACQPKAFAPDFELCANPCKTRLIKFSPAWRRRCVAMFSRSTGYCVDRHIHRHIWVAGQSVGAPAAHNVFIPRKTQLISPQKTATYATKLCVFDSTHRPDFLAIDRYEADDFTYRAYGNGYCFGLYEWPRFFKDAQPDSTSAGDALADSIEPHASHQRFGLLPVTTLIRSIGVRAGATFGVTQASIPTIAMSTRKSWH